MPIPTPSDLKRMIRSLIRDELRAHVPYVARVATVTADGYELLRQVDDAPGAPMPAVAPGKFLVNERVVALPMPDGFDVILGKVVVTEEPPVGAVITEMDWLATPVTPSTTNTGSTVQALSHTINLPPGTWTIEALGFLDLQHSVATGGNTRLAIEIDGVEDGGNRIAPGPNTDDAWVTARRLFSQTGKSGSIAVRVRYRSVDSGTTTAFSPVLLIRAIRTA